MKRWLWLLLLLSPAAWALNEGLGPPPMEVDRRTPAASLQGFVDACFEGKYGLAAHYLSLNHVPKEQQPNVGPAMARRLKFVLDRAAKLNLETLKKDWAEQPSGRYEQVAAVSVGDSLQSIRLRRTSSEQGEAWVFGEDTVRAIPLMYRQYGPPFSASMPDWLFRHTYLGLELWQWLGLLTSLLVSVVFALILEKLLLLLASRLTSLTSLEWDDDLVASGRGPLRLPLFGAFFALGASLLLLPPPAQGAVNVLVRSLTIIAVSWLLLRLLRLLARVVERRVSEESGESARSIHTQLVVLRRVLEVVIYFLGAAILLLQFDVVRHLGVSLLASAGIATLLFGLAAQKSMSNLLAGIQLSITQPIRIGDNVVVEGENGTVEEINLTYVVVSTWDMRRMVIPINHFLEKPFQNWSKGRSQILGVVTLEVDFMADVNRFREEIGRVLKEEAKELWDGKQFSIKVTSVTEKCVTLRVLLSARDPDTSWDLRCLVRERMVQMLAQRPEWIPVARGESRTPKNPSSN